MAHVDQAKKQKIAAALKDVVPKGWKYSLSVRNHSTICMTIRSAPIDLIAISNEVSKAKRIQRGYEPGYAAEKSLDINVYHTDFHYEGELLETINKILGALNTDNFDKSDLMTDYHHCGHYVSLFVGRWDKPFVVK